MGLTALDINIDIESQPPQRLHADVSRISNGKLDRFSLERLMTMIHRLGIDIELVQTRDQDGYLIVNVRRLEISSL